MGGLPDTHGRLLLRLLPPHVGERRGLRHRRGGRGDHRDPQQRLFLDVHRDADPLRPPDRQVRAPRGMLDVPADRLRRFVTDVRRGRVLDDGPGEDAHRRRDGGDLRPADEADIRLVPEEGLRRPERRGHRRGERGRHSGQRTPEGAGRRRGVEGRLPHPGNRDTPARDGLRRRREGPSVPEGPPVHRGRGQVGGGEG